jgi:carboxymethylenebutenolidase
MRPKLNDMQEYLVTEFVEDYLHGEMTRRDMIKRVLGITGGVAATASLLLALGCTPQQAQPAATATAGSAGAQFPTPGASPVSAATPAAAATTVVAATPAAATPAASAATPAAGTPAAAATATGPRSRYTVAATDAAVNAGDVTFPGEGATIMAYMARPTGSGPFSAVMVCHENRGLTDHIRDVTRRLAKAGFVALAVDLLSRDGGTARVDPTQVPGRLGANPAQNVSDFQAAFRYLQGLPFVRQNATGMVGFCFGGGITWRTAVAEPGLKAAVPYYGPAPAVEDVPKIQAAVLAVYGETDTRITSSAAPIEQAMKANGKTFEKQIYPGAGHAFHNDTGNAWNEQAAYDAWEKTLAWFRRYLAG